MEDMNNINTEVINEVEEEYEPAMDVVPVDNGSDKKSKLYDVAEKAGIIGGCAFLAVTVFTAGKRAFGWAKNKIGDFKAKTSQKNVVTEDNTEETTEQ